MRILRIVLKTSINKKEHDSNCDLSVEPKLSKECDLNRDLPVEPILSILNPTTRKKLK